jgi:short chain dehydrogenase
MSALNDKVALVTGSSRGIGAAIARVFAQHGAKVALHGRDRAALAAVRADIERAGGTAMPVAADVTRFAEIEAMRQAIERELGPIEILVANAGGSFTMPGPLEQISFSLPMTRHGSPALFWTLPVGRLGSDHRAGSPSLFRHHWRPSWEQRFGSTDSQRSILRGGTANSTRIVARLLLTASRRGGPGMLCPPVACPQGRRVDGRLPGSAARSSEAITVRPGSRCDSAYVLGRLGQRYDVLVAHLRSDPSARVRRACVQAIPERCEATYARNSRLRGSARPGKSALVRASSAENSPATS